MRPQACCDGCHVLLDLLAVDCARTVVGGASVTIIDDARQCHQWQPQGGEFPFHLRCAPDLPELPFATLDPAAGWTMFVSDIFPRT
jgi:hypothetical protein